MTIYKDTPEFGLIEVGTDTYNNCFKFRLYLTEKINFGYSYYESDTDIKIHFNGEKWLLGFYYSVSKKPQPNNLLETLVNIILTDPKLFKKLESHYNDCIKRLNVTIPRLKSELAAAEERLSMYQSINYHNI